MSYFAAKVYCKNFGEEIARISGNLYKPWNLACPENLEENMWLANYTLVDFDEVFLGMSAKPTGWYRFDGKPSEFMKMRRIFPTTDYKVTLDKEGVWRTYTSAEIDESFVICEESIEQNVMILQSREIFYLEELPKVWTMTFDLYLDRPRAQASVENGANVFYVTNSKTSQRIGIPSVFVEDKKDLKFCYGEKCIFTALVIEKLSSVEMFTDANGYFGVMLDDELLEIIPVDLRETKNVTGFASAPWYRQQHGWINNMKIIPEKSRSIVIDEGNSELQSYMDKYCGKFCQNSFARRVNLIWSCYSYINSESLGLYCVDKSKFRTRSSLKLSVFRYEANNLRETKRNKM